MRSILITLFLLASAAVAHAKDFAWLCAVEYTEKRPEWVFVYEDIKIQNGGDYRVFVKWDFPDDPKKGHAKQVWLLSSDFDQFYVVSSAGYDKEGKVVYSEDNPNGGWKYVLPDTYAEAIVETVKEILLKQ